MLRFCVPAIAQALGQGVLQKFLPSFFQKAEKADNPILAKRSGKVCFKSFCQAFFKKREKRYKPILAQTLGQGLFQKFLPHFFQKVGENSASRKEALVCLVD